MRLIDADTLIQDLQSAKYLCYDNNSISRIGNHEIDRCISFVEDAPTITPEERPTSKWIMNKTSPRGRIYTCKHCKKISINKSKYCPKCGARMNIRRANNERD